MARKLEVNQATVSAPRARSVPDFAAWVGIGKSLAWELIRRGQLRAVRVAGRTLILDEDGEKFLRELPPVTP